MLQSATDKTRELELHRSIFVLVLQVTLFTVGYSDQLPECVLCLQNVSGNSRADNYPDRQDLPLVKDDGGSPGSSSDSQKEHLRLRKLLVGDKSKHCNKVARSIYEINAMFWLEELFLRLEDISYFLHIES